MQQSATVRVFMKSTYFMLTTFWGLWSLFSTSKTPQGVQAWWGRSVLLSDGVLLWLDFSYLQSLWISRHSVCLQLNRIAPVPRETWQGCDFGHEALLSCLLACLLIDVLHDIELHVSLSASEMFSTNLSNSSMYLWNLHRPINFLSNLTEFMGQFADQTIKKAFFLWEFFQHTERRVLGLQMGDSHSRGGGTKTCLSRKCHTSRYVCYEASLKSVMQLVSGICHAETRLIGMT